MGWQDGAIRIDTSNAILEETIRVLRQKFEWDGYRLHFAKERLAGLANVVTPRQTLDVIAEDPPDNRILECAVEAGSQYILTWDKDLLRLHQYAGIRILRVSEFLPTVRRMRLGRFADGLH